MAVKGYRSYSYCFDDHFMPEIFSQLLKKSLYARFDIVHVIFNILVTNGNKKI